MKGGQKSPFLLHFMNQKIQEIVEKELAALDLFLVDGIEQEGKSITIYADGMNSITVDQCTTIARKLREFLGEPYDDYEFTVSSPGLDRPFVHLNQYLKNIDKSVEVVLKDGIKLEGKIKSATPSEIVLDIFKKRNPKNKSQKPETSGVLKQIPMDTIKTTKKLIIF